MSQVTLHTRIQDKAGVLDAFSALMNHAERRIHAELLSGRKWTGDVATSLYKQFGISAKLLESAYAARQAKVKSTQELAKLHVSELKSKFDAKTSQIKRKTKSIKTQRKSLVLKAATILKVEAKLEKLQAALDTSTPSNRTAALQRYKSMLGVLHRERLEFSIKANSIRRVKADLHQHKRRVAILRAKLTRAEKRIDSPSLCFGTRKLFKAQFNLKENGFSSHSEWQAAWQRSRSSTFMIEGAAACASGNQFARLTARGKGLFDLELRLPEPLKDFATDTVRFAGRDIHSVRFEGLKFHHQADELAGALTRGIPVSVRFHRDEAGWRIMPTFKLEVAETEADYSCGLIGVDLNVGFISVARTDRFGNIVESLDVSMVTYGRSEDQSRDTIKKVATLVADYAVRHDLPIVSEKLDFDRKKRTLKDDQDARYARMLSSFAYSTFDAALAAACARRGVHHARVNPAYTSIIGRVKFARRYGLSVHRSAALAIARRAMELSEKLPLSFTESRSVGISLDDAHNVTLELPARKDPVVSKNDGTRHVWSDWNEVNKTLRGALAARRPSKRRKPHRSYLGRNDLHSMVCRSRRNVSGKLHPVTGSTG